MSGNSLFRFCFVISLCVHLSLGFFPFFSTTEPSYRPTKFLEVIYQKIKENKSTLEDRKMIPDTNLDSLRVTSVANEVFDIPKKIDNFKMQPSHAQKDYSDDEINKKAKVITERLELDLANFDINSDSLNLFSDYAHLLRICIINNIVYPEAAFKKSMEGTVQLKFILLPDGNLKDIYVVKSSNCLILDVAAIAAVEKANPFPPFPKDLKAKELFVKVPIIYKLN